MERHRTNINIHKSINQLTGCSLAVTMIFLVLFFWNIFNAKNGGFPPISCQQLLLWTHLWTNFFPLIRSNKRWLNIFMVIIFGCIYVIVASIQEICFYFWISARVCPKTTALAVFDRILSVNENISMATCVWKTKDNKQTSRIQ